MSNLEKRFSEGTIRLARQMCEVSELYGRTWEEMDYADQYGWCRVAERFPFPKKKGLKEE